VEVSSYDLLDHDLEDSTHLILRVVLYLVFEYDHKKLAALLQQLELGLEISLAL
jgi:hypothetical protein